MGTQAITFLQKVLFAAVPLIAMTNPVAEVPLFLGLLKDRSTRGMHCAALEVAVGVSVVLCVAAVWGLQLLAPLGIEVSLFRAAGGLLLVVMGLEMLQGLEPEANGAECDPDGRHTLWVPLVMPLLAGPGAIAAHLHGRGTRILTRFPGLILVAIGFQMGFIGVEEFFSLG